MIWTEKEIEEFKNLIKQSPQELYKSRDARVTELKDSLILKLYDAIRKSAFAKGYAILEETKLYEKEGYVGVVKELSLVDLKKGVLVGKFSSVGEAKKKEEEREMALRLAEKRARKRALEELVGRAFINEAVLELERGEEEGLAPAP